MKLAALQALCNEVDSVARNEDLSVADRAAWVNQASVRFDLPVAALQVAFVEHAWYQDNGYCRS